MRVIAAAITLISLALAAPLDDDCGTSYDEKLPQLTSEVASNSPAPPVSTLAPPSPPPAAKPDAPSPPAAKPDAPSPSAAKTDAPPPLDAKQDAPPPSAGGCIPGALFCEDFESYDVGKDVSGSKWTFDGSAAITDDGARGTRSLHLTPGGAPDRGGIKLNDFTPPENKPFYGRLYANVEQFAIGPLYAHFTIAEFAGNPGTERVRPLGGQFIEGTSLWGVGSDGGPSGDWVSWQKSVPTTDAVWTCLEWKLDPADNSVDVWIDGVEKPDLRVSENDHGGSGKFVFPQPFKSMWIGWWLYQENTTPSQFDVRIDDIVIATSKVGC